MHLLALALALFTTTASATPTPVAEAYDAPRITSAITVDGVLDEAGWQDAITVPIAYEWYPGDNIAPPVRTEAYFGYDDSRLYVAFHAWDPDPSAIRAHLMDRDDVGTFVQDDHVTFLLDTFNDERRAFQFRVNPLGVQVDGLFSEIEGFEDFSFDVIWDSAGRITDDGYIVEVAIPLNQLRFPNDEVQTWGVRFERSYPRSVRHRISSNPVDRDRSCILCQINKVDGLRGLDAGMNLQLTPTLTAARSEKRPGFPTGDFEADPVEFEPGFTARWGVTPNVTINATLNPDFSQVEADAAQLDVNNRFALSFPERRPFFLEGADFFLTPIQAVFTRTVAEPIAGAKVTGKQGKNAFGVFAARDRVNQLVLPSNQGSFPFRLPENGDPTMLGYDTPEVTSAVLRYRRDLFAGSTVGALYTGRFGDGYDNQTAGVDAFFRLSGANTLQLQYLHARTDYPALLGTAGQDTEAFDGGAAEIAFNHRSRDWLAVANYSDYSPGFRADNGFVRRVDYRSLTTVLRRFVYGQPDAWFSQMNYGVRAERAYDHGGTLTDEHYSMQGQYNGPLQSMLFLDLRLSRERFNGTRYTLPRLFVMGQIQPTGNVSFGLHGSFGEAIDFANDREGTQVLLQPEANLKVGRGLNLGISHALQSLWVPEGRVFTANITQSTVRYNFSVRAFLRLQLQFRHTDFNQTLYTRDVRDTQQNLFTQLLFSYKLNPQTVLFLGYSDNYLGYATPNADPRRIDLTQTDRTLFFKVGYAWVL